MTTISLRFPDRPDARVAIALTVAADDEGRGRVLVGDQSGAIGWLRIDERAPDLRFATNAELVELATEAQPSLTGLAVVETMSVAEGLLRTGDRVVRFRVADFSRPSLAALDMIVYPWIADPAPTLTGPLAAVQLDEGLPEGLSGSSAGLWIWDSLGTRAQQYAEARAALLTEDPALFDAEPEQGYGATLCPGLSPSALAGGRLLAGERRAAVALTGSTLTFVGLEAGAEPSLIGAPIYACELATLELPGPAETLLVVDRERDGADDLLVAAPASGEVWLFENLGDGLDPTPTLILRGDEPGSFGRSLAHVELGGDVAYVFVVGEPEAGRVHVFDASAGELLRTIADLEGDHWLGVHGVDLPGREELVVTGARELQIHWSVLSGDPRP